MRPLIGISAQVEKDEVSFCYGIETSYLNMIKKAGASTVIIPPLTSLEQAAQICSHLDGIVLSGGDDIDTSFECMQANNASFPCEDLSTSISKSYQNLVRLRTPSEVLLAQYCHGNNMPILGICRGMQIMNFALGGTILTDIPSKNPYAIVHNQKITAITNEAHSIHFVQGTPLFQAFPNTDFLVNSYHHQCVDTLALDLRPMAFADDGIMEALYDPRKLFFWGVQWHPEIMESSNLTISIVSKFIKACINS